MSITEDRLTETHFHQRSIEFDDTASETITGYSYTGKQWLPDSAHARWNHGQPIQLIRVSGGVLKKDGTLGVARITEEYITPDHRHWDNPGRYSVPAPQWVLDLFADSPHTTPEGATK